MPPNGFYKNKSTKCSRATVVCTIWLNVSILLFESGLKYFITYERADGEGLQDVTEHFFNTDDQSRTVRPSPP